MLSMIKRIVIAATLCVIAASVSTSANAQDNEETFTVINDSSYGIYQMYVSPTSYTYWGIDRLGSNVLYPTYRADLAVAPGWYDVKLVDEDGDACVIHNVDFREDDSWTLTNGLLLACEFLTHN